MASALEGALGELEELSRAGLRVAPAACRARIAGLVAQAFGLEAAPALSPSVSRLMDAVYAALDATLAAGRPIAPALLHAAG
jgi:hypothetical protein